MNTLGTRRPTNCSGRRRALTARDVGSDRTAVCCLLVDVGGTQITNSKLKSYIIKIEKVVIKVWVSRGWKCCLRE